MAGFTPLIKKVKAGTLVTFQSSGEDLNFSFGNNSKRFKFSHFALLDIPDIENGANSNNTIQFKNIEGAFTTGLSGATPAPEGDRMDLSESLQNYVLNLEQLLITSPNYNRDNYKTTSERIFNKWLKEIGALRFRNADTVSESNIPARYTEEDENNTSILGDLYSSVYKHIGGIDIDGANFASNRNAFKEVYAYVPSQSGTTPKILFRTLEDDNYYPGQVIKDPLINEYIQGQSGALPILPTGLRANAFYDMDVPVGSLSYLINNDPLQFVWFYGLASNGPNCYFTDTVFTDPTNDVIKRTTLSLSDTITFKRSRLDGIEVDLDVASYKGIDGTTIKTFSDYNSSGSAQSFKFNAVALYYDIYDPTDGSVKATNLYGVCFLNDLVQITAGSSRIEENNKIKQDNVLRTQGNGFGFKFNFKFDVTGNTAEVQVEVSVNDYNTFSMQLFSESIQKIVDLTDRYETVLLQNTQLITEIAQMRSLLESAPPIEELIQRFDAALLDATTASNYTNLLGMINSNTATLEQILLGNTTIGLDFFLDLRGEGGIDLSLVNKVLRIKNKRQRYSSAGVINLYTGVNDLNQKNNIIKLGENETLWYHENSGNVKIADDNIYIYVEDGEAGFQNFQEITLFLKDDITFGVYGLVFYTDSKNRFNQTTSYQKLMGVVPSNMIKKETRIVCLDKDAYTFLIL